MRERTRTGAPVPAMKRERRKAETRSQLLRAGRRLFSERGLYAARIEDLSEMAGIAKGTLYLYFPDKLALIGQVISDGYDELGSYVARRAVGAGSPRALLRRVTEAHFEFLVANPDLLRIFHQGRGMLLFGRREWRPLAAPLRRHLALVAGILGASAELRRLGAGGRTRLATLILGLVSGTSSVALAVKPGGGGTSYRDDVARAASELADAVRRRARPRREAS